MFAHGRPVHGAPGRPGHNAACCCAFACEHNCQAGTLPLTFDLTVPHFLFFRTFDNCDYDTGTDTSPYGGNFTLDRLTIAPNFYGGRCAYFYCGDDPCAPGKKFVWLLSTALATARIRATVMYGLNAPNCLASEVTTALDTSDWMAADDFVQVSPGPGVPANCCNLSASDIQWFGAINPPGAHVTLGGGPYLLTASANC